ncbi:hypothetical protein HZ326_7497 [Fusarium oxysporum f. sp. albedinis]|nr:hypothetical protein HZ326_7497 [Fusarium oxysporum f. sp. albedinis]
MLAPVCSKTMMGGNLKQSRRRDDGKTATDAWRSWRTLVLEPGAWILVTRFDCYRTTNLQSLTEVSFWGKSAFNDQQ